MEAKTQCDNRNGVALSDLLAEAKPTTKNQSSQTLTFLLWAGHHKGSQTDVEASTDDESRSSDSGQEDSAPGMSKQRGCFSVHEAEGLRVRQTLISAGTTCLLTAAVSSWCSPSAAMRMRQQRLCFHRLKSMSGADYAKQKLEEEKCKTMQLQSEIAELKNLHAMQESLNVLREVHRPSPDIAMLFNVRTRMRTR